jgi:hypothetical protein
LVSFYVNYCVIVFFASAIHEIAAANPNKASGKFTTVVINRVISITESGFVERIYMKPRNTKSPIVNVAAPIEIKGPETLASAREGKYCDIRITYTINNKSEKIIQIKA